MKFELVCQNCASINRNAVPIPSKNDGVDLYCWSCNGILITFFADEHFMAEAIEKWIDRNKEHQKVIE